MSEFSGFGPLGAYAGAAASGAGVRVASVIFAAANSEAADKASADIVCTGTYANVDNDGATIQDGLDAAVLATPSGAITALFLPGIYLMGGDINLNSDNSHIIGCDGTEFHQYHRSEINIKGLYSSISGVLVTGAIGDAFVGSPRDLAALGSGYGYNYEGIAAAVFNYGDYGVIADCSLRGQDSLGDLQYGVALEGVMCKAYRNYVKSSHNPINLDGAHSLAVENEVHLNGPIYSSGTGQVVASNTIFGGTTGTANPFPDHGNGVSNYGANLIADNVAHACDYGISTVGSALIVGNVVGDSTGKGVFLSRVVDCLVAGNLISDSVLEGIDASGHSNSIHSNLVRGALVGLSIGSGFAGGFDTFVSHNDLLDNTTGYTDAGAATITGQANRV